MWKRGEYKYLSFTKRLKYTYIIKLSDNITDYFHCSANDSVNYDLQFLIHLPLNNRIKVLT